MGSLRQDLLAAAAAAVREDLLRRLPFQGRTRQFAVVLGGSGVTDDCDEYSGCDLIVFSFAAQRAHGRAERTPQPAQRWQNVRRGRHRYRYAVLSFDSFCASVARGDDEAVYLVRHGVVLHDPQERLQALWRKPPELPQVLWTRKLAQRYRAFRQRRASLAWSLRRGQPVLVLDNLRQMLEHALCCCYYLEGQPPPPRKWVFRGGLRTPGGRSLREPVLDLLSSLSDLATLGGSLNLRHNRLYQRVSELQSALEAVLVRGGLPVPGLVAMAVGSGEAEDEGRFLAESRTPRVRRPRRTRRRGEGPRLPEPLVEPAEPGSAG